MLTGFAEADDCQRGEHVAGAGEEARKGWNGEGEKTWFVARGGGTANH